MTEAPLRLTAAEIDEDRFSRFRLMPWWDQERIHATKVLVVGAGALGNEILKNLALLGFRQVVIADLDTVEMSNLSRSVLYRPQDIGRAKVDAAAAAYSAIYSDAAVVSLRMNILHEAGLGLFDWADIILAGLDNREARLWINRCAWRVRRPWVDGAIEGLSGVARMFLPGEPPCYECTLGETDWRILHRRMSCNLLTRQEMEAGRTPTTPTTAAVIGGVQVQEALKYVHGLPVLGGRGFVFDGVNHTSYTVQYTENPECLSHDSCPQIVRLAAKSSELTLSDVMDAARQHFGVQDVVVEFSRDIIHKLRCPRCGIEDEFFVPVGTLETEQARCRADGLVRVVSTIHQYTGSESWGGLRLTEIGLPLWDLYTARAGEQEIGILIAGDQERVLSGGRDA